MIGQHSLPAQTVKILTFNTFMRPPGIKNSEGDYKDERLSDILDEMDKYEVVCLQEIFGWGTSRRDKLIEEAVKKQFYFWMMAPMPGFGWGPAFDGGICVLSKFPILQGYFIPFQTGVLSDAAFDKGFIYCKIQIKETVLHLFNTHLQASYIDSSPRHRRASEKVRLQQLIFLRNKIKKVMEAKDQLCLLVGDLNFKGKEKEEYEQMMSVLNIPGMKVYDCLFQRYGYQPITFGENDRILTAKSDWSCQQRLDYILHLEFSNSHPSLVPLTETCSVEKFFIQNRPYSQLSDHYGVSIELKIV